MADSNKYFNNSKQTFSQPMNAPRKSSLTYDGKRMSFDGGMPYSVSPTTGFGLASGFGSGGGNSSSAPTYNRTRKDSLKNMVHLQDFGTD